MELLKPSVRRLVLAVATVGVVLAGGVAVASPPAADDVITGCVDSTNGQLRVVDGNTACRRGENRITWNQEGPAGAQGARGPQGDPGPAGAGLTSFDDLDGLTCRAGDPLEGVLEVTYGPGGAASLTCLATALEDLTVTVAGGLYGFVASTPGGIDCDADCTESYRRGTAVELRALPSGGATFLGWGGACTGTALTCRVTMAAAASVTARFAPTADLEVVVRNPASTTLGTSVVTGPGGFSCTHTGIGSNLCMLTVPVTGAPVTLTAVPDASSDDGLLGWTGPCSGAQLTCTFVPVPGFNPRITATFRG
jgi:hypothetical protein